MRTFMLLFLFVATIFSCQNNASQDGDTENQDNATTENTETKL